MASVWSRNSWNAIYRPVFYWQWNRNAIEGFFSKNWKKKAFNKKSIVLSVIRKIDKYSSSSMAIVNENCSSYNWYNQQIDVLIKLGKRINFFIWCCRSQSPFLQVV